MRAFHTVHLALGAACSSDAPCVAQARMAAKEAAAAMSANDTPIKFDPDDYD